MRKRKGKYSKRYRRRSNASKYFLSPAKGLICLILASVACLGFIWLLGDEQDNAANQVAVVKDFKQDFIDQIAPRAKELQKEYGILPSIILGQAILESDWGRSQLAATYNNLFGVKASEGHKKIHLTTKEFLNGQWLEVTADFRVYPDWASSIEDHTQLFVNGVSWNPTLYHGVLNSTNYRDAANALQAAGYATDPDYAEKIISVIEENNLARFDTQ